MHTIVAEPDPRGDIAAGSVGSFGRAPTAEPIRSSANGRRARHLGSRAHSTATTWPRQAGAFAAAVGLGLSGTVVALPAVASAAPLTQTFDIWNLTSTALNVNGYDRAKDYNAVPADKLPQDKVIPMGKNLQITVAIGQGVITNFAGSQPAQQGGTQTWKVATTLEDMDSLIPFVHLVCVPGDTRIAACGVTSGNNVQALADAPGTTINVPASDKQKQAELRSAFCDHPYRQTLQIQCKDFAGAKLVIAGNTTWTWPDGR